MAPGIAVRDAEPGAEMFGCAGETVLERRLEPGSRRGCRSGGSVRKTRAIALATWLAGMSGCAPQGAPLDLPQPA